MERSSLISDVAAPSELTPSDDLAKDSSFSSAFVPDIESTPSTRTLGSPTMITRRICDTFALDFRVSLPSSPEATHKFLPSFLQTKTQKPFVTTPSDQCSSSFVRSSSASPEPFCPVIPDDLLSSSQDSASDGDSIVEFKFPISAVSSPLLSIDSNTTNLNQVQQQSVDEFHPSHAQSKPSFRSHLASTRDHLLQLATAASSFGFLSNPPTAASSSPSSAASSAPSSPGFSSGIVSPSSVTDSFSLYTPDSPSWLAAHQTRTNLSVRRRAMEIVRGSESAARMRMRGASSRTTSSTCASPQSIVYTDSGCDSSGFSDCETPSPSFVSGRRASLIKPLLSSEGFLYMQATIGHAFDRSNSPLLLPSTSSASASPGRLCASAINSSILLPSPLIDVEVVAKYLTPLSRVELIATIHPITHIFSYDIVHSIMHSSSPVSSPVAFDTSSLVSSVYNLSQFQLSLLLDRCVARSNWRKSIPSDLLMHAFSYLDLASLVQHAMPVSRYFKSISCELVGTSEWKLIIATKKEQLNRKRKMRVYRRLSPNDMKAIQAAQTSEEIDRDAVAEDVNTSLF